MNKSHQVLHGIAVKKHANAEEVAHLLGEEVSDIQSLLDTAEQEQRIVALNEKYMLSPLGRIILDSNYSLEYMALRENPDFYAAYEQFEKINITVKSLITDWQTLEVGGQRVANDHSNSDYDMSVIDRLGDLHEKADAILTRLETALPRIKIYRDHLLEALEKAEDGATEWVSDAKINSYHTVWFELHEDLLRVLGQERQE